MIGTSAALLREAERVVDRLRVLVPSWRQRASAADAEAAARVRAVLQDLADLAGRADLADLATADGIHRVVPELGLHALADQLLVLVHEAAAAGAAPTAAAHDLLVRLRREL